MTKPDPYIDESYVFGPVIGAHDIDELIYQMVVKWQVSYLREVSRRSGEAVDELRPFRSFRVSHELDHMPEDQTPGLIIVNLGIVEPPTKTGTLRPGKTFSAIYRYQLGCLASAKGKKVNAAPRANKVAKMYALAMRLILTQKRDEDTRVLGMLDWIDDGPGPLTSDDDRTIAMWHTDFNVNVPNAASWATGPLVPDELPDGMPTPPLWPDVTSVEVDATKVSIEEDV